MKLASRIQFWFRFTCALLLASCLLGAPASVLPVQAGDAQTFKIKLYDTGIKEMCVGESTTITGAYWPAPGSLAPLTGPVLQFSASRGTVSPRRMLPASASDIFQFTYKAEKAGQEEIRADALRHYDGGTEASASLKIKVVEKCAYAYELNAEMYANAAAGDVVEKIKYTIKVKGGLEPIDLSQSNRLESHPSIKLSTVLVEFKAPDCSLVDPNVGRGLGFIDVYAELVNDGQQIHVWFSPPYQLAWDYDVSVACPDFTVNVNKNIPISSDKDPWIEATMQASGGQRGVTVDLFQKGVKNFTSYGTPAYYFATLKLTKKTEK